MMKKLYSLVNRSEFAIERRKLGTPFIIGNTDFIVEKNYLYSTMPIILWIALYKRQNAEIQITYCFKK